MVPWAQGQVQRDESQCGQWLLALWGALALTVLLTAAGQHGPFHCSSFSHTSRHSHTLTQPRTPRDTRECTGTHTHTSVHLPPLRQVLQVGAEDLGGEAADAPKMGESGRPPLRWLASAWVW